MIALNEVDGVASHYEGASGHAMRQSSPSLGGWCAEVYDGC